MNKIQIEIELTDKQIEFIKSIDISSKKEFNCKIEDYDMYNDLIKKGIVQEYYSVSGITTSKFISDIGFQIKQLLS